MTLARTQEEKLARDLIKMKKVCPLCKPDNNPLSIVDGQTVFSPLKSYKCINGHLSLIGLLPNFFHIKYGPNNLDFINIEGQPNELETLIDTKEISCHNCEEKLIPIDNAVLSIPNIANIKTKTRVGDLWDRQGIEPVRQGSYNKDGEYNPTRTESINKERLRQIRKNRNIPLDKLPNIISINKPTKKRK